MCQQGHHKIQHNLDLLNSLKKGKKIREKESPKAMRPYNADPAIQFASVRSEKVDMEDGSETLLPKCQIEASGEIFSCFLFRCKVRVIFTE